MKKLTYICFVLTLSFAVQLQAQQDPHFSLYKFNMNVINPAYAGTQAKIEGIFGVRSQWSGLPGAPETYNMNVNASLGDHVGAGLSVTGDQVFVLSETHLYADFSYRIQLAEALNLYAGIKAGGSFLNVDLAKTNVENDPLFGQNISTFNPNVGVGFYLKGEKYYVTLSAPGLLQNDRFEKEGVTPVSATDEVHFFAGGGYDFDISENFAIRPATLARVVSGAPLSWDFTASGVYADRIELGANYRLDESVTFFGMFGFIDNLLNFGYAYEYTTTEINDFANGSHEVVIRIRIQ